MKAKEKAKELHDKYYYEIWNNVSFDDESEVYESAKQCALLCVDLIIRCNPHSNPFNTDVYSTMEFWIKVKQEIEKL